MEFAAIMLVSGAALGVGATYLIRWLRRASPTMKQEALTPTGSRQPANYVVRCEGKTLYTGCNLVAAKAARIKALNKAKSAYLLVNGVFRG